MVYVWEFGNENYRGKALLAANLTFSNLSSSAVLSVNSSMSLFGRGVSVYKETANDPHLRAHKGATESNFVVISRPVADSTRSKNQNLFCNLYKDGYILISDNHVTGRVAITSSVANSVSHIIRSANSTSDTHKCCFKDVILKGSHGVGEFNVDFSISNNNDTCSDCLPGSQVRVVTNNVVRECNLGLINGVFEMSSNEEDNYSYSSLSVYFFLVSISVGSLALIALQIFKATHNHRHRP
jgi:hypothetical protein